MDENRSFNVWLAEALPRLSYKRALLGFDGFIDQLVSVEGMRDMRRLADYLYARDGMSGGLEVKQIARKMGGNMPITANALGQLGLPCDCVGALGAQAPDAIFQSMSKNCVMYPVVPPAACMALEFDTGKLMLAENSSIRSMDFNAVTKAIGLAPLISMHAAAALWGYFNWSELMGLTDILKGALTSVLPKLPTAQPRIAYFDLSDCTARAASDLREALCLMQKFGQYARTVLSVNENEARHLLRLYRKKSMTEPASLDDTLMEQQMRILYEALGMDSLVVRHNRRVYAFDGQALTAVDTFFVSRPKLMTGAGDNYNAGLMAGLLLGGDWQQALTLGALTSSFYIRNGYSPSQAEVSQAALEMNR